MSIQSSRTIFGENKNILRDAQHFISLPVKVSATLITANSNGKKILSAGSIVDNTGKIVNDGTAYGFVYEDVDFTNSTGIETVPVVVHGIIDSKQIPIQPTAEALAAMKLISIV
ncbi:hypothetical protein GTH52_07100 [Clostridium tyrobutyricum]|uniref:Phage protein n=1 Tax=Clostridium tyrobutyricum DIVETGP TaxID=1408889 RepID=W6N5U8_CLOTY|nr:hypothetical protein [Clostridium tyrobutyricum]AND84265.1 hypothetical protein CTK_C10040 [Clostridium tyrobutyricum]AND84349.1 phage protein [Clostridium tyrobutyricum]ANP68981.1 hypothetical protein BA182_04620 [Clostridium tyrobutyricum]MBV4432410.1 hypothetical protein [Clostridium tyrobutyricum]MBV4435415.1 hypothetical protein [Clostridium tyrobutyricum]